MNVFFLDYDHRANAMCHVDSYVVKIPLESCQMLAGAYPNGDAPYKHTHINHPMSKWVRETELNFYFTIHYAIALCEEYTFRYNKRHKCQDVAIWYLKNPPHKFNSFEFSKPPRCFGKFADQIPITDCVVTDYRNYYKVAKQHLFKWKNRETPDWI